MDQEKNPVDLLDEILNRGQEEPRPSSYPPRFDPPLPANEPPPPEQKAPLRERAVPWLCGLLGGAAVTGLLCAVLLTSLNQRLDQLGAAVDEIRAVDELREENERLRTSIRSLVTTQQDMLSSQREQEQITQQRQQRYSELLNHTGRQPSCSIWSGSAPRGSGWWRPARWRTATIYSPPMSFRLALPYPSTP